MEGREYKACQEERYSQPYCFNCCAGDQCDDSLYCWYGGELSQYRKQAGDDTTKCDTRWGFIHFSSEECCKCFTRVWTCQAFPEMNKRIPPLALVWRLWRGSKHVSIVNIVLQSAGGTKNSNDGHLPPTWLGWPIRTKTLADTDQWQHHWGDLSVVISTIESGIIWSMGEKPQRILI